MLLAHSRKYKDPDTHTRPQLIKVICFRSTISPSNLTVNQIDQESVYHKFTLVCIIVKFLTNNRLLTTIAPTIAHISSMTTTSTGYSHMLWLTCSLVVLVVRHLIVKAFDDSIVTEIFFISFYLIELSQQYYRNFCRLTFSPSDLQLKLIGRPEANYLVSISFYFRRWLRGYK